MHTIASVGEDGRAAVATTDAHHLVGLVEGGVEDSVAVDGEVVTNNFFSTPLPTLPNTAASAPRHRPSPR